MRMLFNGRHVVFYVKAALKFKLITFRHIYELIFIHERGRCSYSEITAFEHFFAIKTDFQKMLS